LPDLAGLPVPVQGDAGSRSLDRRDGDFVIGDAAGLLDRGFDGSRLTRNKRTDDVPDYGLA
jgi:hypothetical protein